MVTSSAGMPRINPSQNVPSQNVQRSSRSVRSRRGVGVSLDPDYLEDLFEDTGKTLHMKDGQVELS